MTSFPASELLCHRKNPLDWNTENIRLMVEACQEFALFHEKNSPDLAALYARKKFDPRTIQEESDLERIPFVNVSAMKSFLMLSLPEEKAALKLTSSGTRGQKTQIWFDAGGLSRVQSQLDVLWEQEGTLSQNLTNYCCFIYDPKDTDNLGIAFTVENEQRFAPKKNSYFVVKKNQKGGWEFDKKKAYEVLKSYEREGLPTRILGIPSFLFELIEEMREGELQKFGPIQLPPDSWVLIGGGWKAAEDKKISREKFRILVNEALGIPIENQRDNFGMAEHSAPYIECKKHRFHVPVFNRVFSREPSSLRVLPPGELGLLEFISPYNAMMPNLAILSTDLGLIDPTPCLCGRNSPTFTVVGRGGLIKHKGCALTATDIVKRK